MENMDNLSEKLRSWVPGKPRPNLILRTYNDFLDLIELKDLHDHYWFGAYDIYLNHFELTQKAKDINLESEEHKEALDFSLEESEIQIDDECFEIVSEASEEWDKLKEMDISDIQSMGIDEWLEKICISTRKFKSKIDEADNHKKKLEKEAVEDNRQFILGIKISDDIPDGLIEIKEMVNNGLLKFIENQVIE